LCQLANWPTPLDKARSTCHTKTMKNNNTFFRTNDAADENPAITLAKETFMRAYYADLERRKAIREGRIPNVHTKTWNISDRD